MKPISDSNGRDSGSCDSAARLLSPRQLAERWSCTPTTAQRIAARAGISKYLLGEGRNGMVRYPLAEVEAYEQARRFRFEARR